MSLKLASGTYHIMNPYYNSYLTQLKPTTAGTCAVTVKPAAADLKTAVWHVTQRESDGRYIIGMNTINAFYEAGAVHAEKNKDFGWTLVPRVMADKRVAYSVCMDAGSWKITDAKDNEQIIVNYPKDIHMGDLKQQDNMAYLWIFTKA
ncbi:hypothetical protein NM688_g9074 [Phlebia brevispora]|uniref:Uncharacterized protein n=1 Tax=Phlebia brevispora TaxID=194682 RepID=A0ACC1RLM5_9APHY|nr:hypothetical protein NM688_g9074 [Phlebia brevispora]